MGEKIFMLHITSILAISSAAVRRGSAMTNLFLPSDMLLGSYGKVRGDAVFNCYAHTSRQGVWVICHIDFFYTINHLSDT